LLKVLNIFFIKGIKNLKKANKDIRQLQTF